jgi:hypothetical protein
MAVLAFGDGPTDRAWRPAGGLHRNPANGGYASVAVYGLAIFVGMVAIAWAVVAAGNGVTARRSPEGSFASAG